MTMASSRSKNMMINESMTPKMKFVPLRLSFNRKSYESIEGAMILPEA